MVIIDQLLVFVVLRILVDVGPQPTGAVAQRNLHDVIAQA
jgi:hypothetical protein